MASGKQLKMNFDNLTTSKMNRPLQRPQVDRLKELIRKHGYINSMPIIVDENGTIIDGQHRYQACKELGIEAPITVEKTFDIVPIINSSQLRWTIEDYVNYYAEKGFEHYIILRALCKSKNIKPGIAYNIIFGKSVDRTGMATQLAKYPLKDGTLKLPDTSEKGLAKLERKIDKILDLILDLGLPRTDRLIIALTRLTTDPNFSFATMKSKIAYQKSKIYRCSTIQEYMQMLSSIYNYKNAKKVAS